MNAQAQIKKNSFFDKLIIRWYTSGEGRVLLESYLVCSLIPYFYIFCHPGH